MLAWFAASIAATGGAAPTDELLPGLPLSFEHPAGTVTELAFDVGEDQFIHLEVLQMGADVALTVLGPGGDVFRQVDDAQQEDFLETVSFTRARRGRYRLRLAVSQRTGRGRFEVRLDPPRPAAPTDDLWLRSERALVEGMKADRLDVAARGVVAEALRRAIHDWGSLGEERWVALAQTMLGTSGAPDTEEALELCLEAADYAERSGDRALEESVACANSLLSDMGYLEESIASERQLLATRRRASDPFAVLESLLNLSNLFIRTGELEQAEALLVEAVETARASGDLTAEAIAGSRLGRLHRERGEYQQALDAYGRSLTVPHVHERVRASTLAALASLQLDVGDLDAATASAHDAGKMARKLGYALAEISAMAVLGRIDVERAAFDQAVSRLSHAVALARRHQLPARAVTALVALGHAEAALGRTTAARRHQQEALTLSRAHDDRIGEALVLVALCELDDAGAGSASSCETALEVGQAMGPGPVALLSRFYLARAARRRGDLQAARLGLEESLAAVETQRLDLRRSDLRQTFSATVDDIEDEYVDVLVDLASTDPAGGWDVLAFEASERSRGRSLRDELAESRSGIRQGADPALLQEENALRDRLRAALARQLRGGNAPAAALDLNRTIGGLQASLADVAARLRLASPRYASLSQPERQSLDAIRAALLDDDTVLLSYALGERRSFLWVVTRTSLERHVLPARKEIERLARGAVAAASTRRAAGRDLAPLGRVLLTPAARRLDASRVVVVADGVLHLVPFAALPSPRAPGPLLDRSEVVHLPSASAGVLLARVPPRTGPNDVAVFADPVFRADDERVQDRPRVAATGKRASLPRELTRDGRLARLPFTRREARAIQALAGPGGRVALDFDASREAVLDERLSSYRIVHFATHGLLNASRPELSGIVLSLVDRTGRPQNGFLTALDAYNLQLDADLVVLSGCRTGLGKDVRSEGIVGLTRGFMYAGARGVLASLWPVDDAATAELMRAFYAGLLGPQKLSPPAALRAAQRQVRSDPRWRAPYYWAAFQLQGVWAPDEAPRAGASDPRP